MIQRLVDGNSNEVISFIELAVKIRKGTISILSKWHWITLAIICGGIVGLIYANSKKRKYIAEYTFVIDNGDKGSSSTYSSIEQQFGFSLGGSGASGVFESDNIIELLKSKLIVGKSLLAPLTVKGRKYYLINRYIEIYKLRNEWKKSPDILAYYYTGDTTKSKRTLNTIIDIVYSSAISKNVLIEKQKKSNLFSLKVSSVDEDFSKDFADALIYNVSLLYLQTKVGRKRQTITALEKKTDSVRKNLMSAMHGLAISEDNNLNVIRQVGKVNSRSQNLNVSLLQTIYTELVKNLETQRISLLNETPLIQIVDKPDYPLQISFVSWSSGLITGVFFGLLASILALIIRSLLVEIYIHSR